MAVILKSNKTATGDFLYPTEFGLTSLEVKNFVDAQSLLTSTITQTQFDALHNLHQALRDSNLYENVIDIMPFLGSKIQGQLTKSKFLRDEKLDGLYGFGSDQGAVDSGKGVQWTDYLLTGALALDTKLIDSDFVKGLRFSTYINLDPATNATNNIFGKGPAILDNSTRTFFQNGGDQLGISTGNTAFSSFLETIDGPCLVSGALTIENNIIKQRKGYKNGSLIMSSEPTEIALNNNTTYYIGGLNQGNGVTPLYGLVGKMRFFIITNGNISDTENLTLNNICLQFIQDSEKTF